MIADRVGGNGSIAGGAVVGRVGVVGGRWGGDDGHHGGGFQGYGGDGVGHGHTVLLLVEKALLLKVLMLKV